MLAFTQQPYAGVYNELSMLWQEPAVRDVESEFWRIVEDGDEAVDVLTGMDLDSTEYGSGFPTAPEPSDGAQVAHAAARWTDLRSVRLTGGVPRD